MPNDGPAADCSFCSRLAEFRRQNSANFPGWHNAPVPSFGPLDAQLLLVGLAPGLRGANRTGRPFTGDYAGDLLFDTLSLFGFAKGGYDRRPDDDLVLVNCRITNAVRCVPPQNRPTGYEISTCRRFLSQEISTLPRLRIILALGGLAHRSVVAAFSLRQADCKFSHGARHELPGILTLVNSYHCSRYNTNTGRLTETMFAEVFDAIAEELKS